jgi:hypothetical protein
VMEVAPATTRWLDRSIIILIHPKIVVAVLSAYWRIWNHD